MTEAIATITAAYTAAWNSGSAEAVASFYAATGGIVINRGTPWEGRAGVQAMAEGFFADVPDLTLTCDGLRVAGDHVVYLWTFTGHHAGTGNPLRIAEAVLPYTEALEATGAPGKRVTRHLLELTHGQPGARSWRRTLGEIGGSVAIRQLLDQARTEGRWS